MKIVTLTLNPCLDRTVWVEEFGLPPVREEWQIGGKGINVARVLHALGADCAAVAPLGGESGMRFRELAAREGVPLCAVEVAQTTRTIDTFARTRDYAQRVSYRTGDELSASELDRLEAALFSALSGARALAVCGSACGAAAARRVPEILSRARALGIATVLDSNGPALLEGVKAAPDLVKPNLAELSALTGRTLDNLNAADAAAEWLSSDQPRPKAVLLSLGERGCAYIRDGMQRFCPAPKVRAVNAVGSGDSFTAGFLFAASRGLSDDSALEIANAAGAANAGMFPAARIGRAEIEETLGRPIDDMR